MTKVRNYIETHMDLAVCSCAEDTEERFGLPYPYSVPTIEERFHAMFYWDTYFTNLALIELGNIQQAKHNIDNFVALIKRLGYVPNGNTVGLSNRSQPPFMALMVRDLLPYVKDLAWEAEVYEALCEEHRFWIDSRSTSKQLQHYGGEVPKEKEERYAKSFCERVGLEYTPQVQAVMASNFFAQAESGWDFNARFELDSIHYCPVDLNSLIWAQEKLLSTLAEHLGKPAEAAEWQKLANQREKRMREYLLQPESGVYLDRNSATNRFSPVFSAASLYPMFVGLATQAEADSTMRQIHRLMHRWGIVPCEADPASRPFQWGAPNGWACLQVVAAEAFRRYGYTKEAEELEQKYVTMVDNVFEATGALWEKYNLDSGSCDAINEYEMPEMLGWTAGAYLFFQRQNKSERH